MEKEYYIEEVQFIPYDIDKEIARSAVKFTIVDNTPSPYRRRNTYKATVGLFYLTKEEYERLFLFGNLTENITKYLRSKYRYRRLKEEEFKLVNNPKLLPTRSFQNQIRKELINTDKMLITHEAKEKAMLYCNKNYDLFKHFCMLGKKDVIDISIVLTKFLYSNTTI